MLALEATLSASSPVVCLTQFAWQNVRQELGGHAYYQGFLKEVWGKSTNLVAPAALEGPPDFADVRAAVVQTLQKFLPNGADGFTDDAEFDELGLDSLSGVEASRALGTALSQFGISTVKPTFLFEANCLRSVLSKLQASRPTQPTQPAQPAQPATIAQSLAAAKPTSDIKSVVVETLERFLPNGKEGLTENAEFDELGLDSLSGVDASRALAAALAPLGVGGIKPTFLFEANSLTSVLGKLDKLNTQKAVQPAQCSGTEKRAAQKPMAVVPLVNVHAIGEPTPLERHFFATMSVSLRWFLRMLSEVPFFVMLTVCFRQTHPVVQLTSPTFALFGMFVFYSMACVTQLFSSFILMWAAKNLLLGTVKEGIWPIWGWKMACLKGLRHFEEWVLALPTMKAMERTELPNVLFRLMGSQIGRGAYISLSDDLPLIPWDLLSVGEAAVLDGMNISGSNHIFHVHRPLSIGSGCVIGHNATLKPGSAVGNGALVLPHSTVTGEVGAQKVHDGSAGTSTATLSSDIDSDRLLSFPRRTPMSLPASLVVLPFLWWLQILSYWPFIVDLAYVSGRYLPWVMGGKAPGAEEDFIVILLLLPVINILAALLYDLFVVVAAVASKWLFLGRLEEGSFFVSSQYLFFFEISFNLTSAAAQVMRNNSQTIANNIFMKAMGGDVAWSWMPSPLNPAAYFCADLLTIESDVFSASKCMFNCITLIPSGDSKTFQARRWQMTCRRIHMGKRSFTGPWTLVTGGSSLGEGSATMDQTYVPAGTQIPAWRTMMGTSVDGRFMVKRKQASRLPHGLFPYVLALFLNAFAGRILRLWFTASLPFASGVFLLRFWESSVFLALGQVRADLSITTHEIGICAGKALLFLAELSVLFPQLDMASNVVMFLLHKHCLLGRVTPSSGGQLRGWDNLKWVSAYTNTPHNMTALKPYSCTPILTWLAKAGGAQVGENVQIHWRGFQGCPELDMITLGDDVYIGGAFYSHKFAATSLAFSAVTVGQGVHTGGRSMLSPGSHLPPNAIALEGTLVIPGSADLKSHAKQYLSGNPAVSETSPPEGVFEINGRHL